MLKDIIAFPSDESITTVPAFSFWYSASLASSSAILSSFASGRSIPPTFGNPIAPSMLAPEKLAPLI